MNNEKGVRLMAANTNEKQQIQFDADQNWSRISGEDPGMVPW